MASPMLAQPFPDFDIDTFSTKHAKSAGAMLIVVWRTECPTCQLLLPFIDRMAAQYPAATVVGIAQNTQEELDKYVNADELNMQMYADPHLRLSSFLGVDIVPTYWLVGRDCKTQIRGVGWERDKILQLAHTLAVETSATYVPIFTKEDHVPILKAG